MSGLAVRLRDEEGATADGYDSHKLIAGVSPGTRCLHLVGGGPFTPLRVIGACLDPTGEVTTLDVATPDGQTYWEGIACNHLLYMP